MGPESRHRLTERALQLGGFGFTLHREVEGAAPFV